MLGILTSWSPGVRTGPRKARALLPVRQPRRMVQRRVSFSSLTTSFALELPNRVGIPFPESKQLVAAREETGDACGGQDVTVRSSCNQRVIKSFRERREIPLRR
jgi:hypothetical protein